MIGFNNGPKNLSQDEDESVLSKVIHHDIKRFGLIPELLGRLPVLTFLKPLTLETMTRILQEPKNALLKQYVKLFELEDIKLTFETEAIEYIASRAMEFGLGARGLRSICEEVLTEAMFELPSDCLLYTSPSPRDQRGSRMPSSA